MKEMFVLWHTQRGGWITASGQTSTNFEKAHPFSWEEASQRMRTFFSGSDKTFGVIAVPQPDLALIYEELSP